VDVPIGQYQVHAKEVMIVGLEKVTLNVGGSTIVMDGSEVKIFGGKIKLNTK
jgi:hypothetical protein